MKFRSPMQILLALAVLACAQTARAQTTAFTLANGLRLIVQEDHRAPTAVQMLWYRAGSMDEVSGESGVAHVLEHLMFKGTRRVKSGEFSRRVAAAGGRENAFTNRDYTAYYQQVPTAALAQMMQLEADRMANLRVTAEEFASEIKVVMEERRLRTEDQPRARVSEALNAQAFLAHPYRRPVIGWMSDLASMSHVDARAWYQRWYAPNNALLVVAGDVKAEAVYALARRYYGPVKAQALPRRKPQTEPEQRGARRIAVHAPAKLPYLMMAWKCPVLRDPARDWEPHALEVLMRVLDGHDAARLGQELVRAERVASEVGAGYDPIARGPGLCFADAVPAEDRSVDEVEQGIKRVIARIALDGIAESELARAKAQLVSNQVFKRDSVFGQAMEIGRYEMAGLSYGDIEAALEGLKAVTAEQVRLVARRYFVDDGLTVARLHPLPPEAKRDAQTP